MNNNPSLPNTPPAAPPSHRYVTGKIGRLPNDIRDQLNRRLLDGQSASDILPWLNELPPVTRILKAKFRGDPIKRQNLDTWRRTGYQLWLQQEQSFLQIHRIARDAKSVSRAGCRALARGTAAIVSSRLYQLVQSAASEKYTLDDYKKIVTTVKPVLAAEQNRTRLKHEYERIRQRERRLILIRDKQQRDVVAIGFRLLGDQRARQIEASDYDNAEKIELLGLHIFGDLWEPRPIPVPGSPDRPQTATPQPAT
jgi:hypothetical protein